MAGRKPKPRRTPAAEWTAAGLGLALTLAVIGYSLWEALGGERGPPALAADVRQVSETPAGFVATIRVRNTGGQTAAAVEVTGEFTGPDGAVHERRATFAYVPAGGEASGGMLFSQDPRRGRLTLTVHGYERP